jgi:hypothetical protein
MEIFERAARLKLRFEVSVGLISAEDLFDLPLTSKSGRANLDTIGRALRQQLKNDDDVSLVDDSSSQDPLIQLRFDIVKHVIEVKKAERAEADKASQKAAQKQEILAALVEAERGALKSKSPEELRAMLADL